MTLPERLRAIRFSSNPDDYDAITIEAAAEIDALTARVAELERQVVDWTVRTGRQVERADATEARAQAAEATLETIRLALFPDPEHHITHHARYNLEGALADLEAGQNDPTVRRTLQRVAGQIAAAEHALQTKDTTP